MRRPINNYQLMKCQLILRQSPASWGIPGEEAAVGVSSAPGIFQMLMDGLLKNIPGAVPYFDDILIAAAAQGELDSRLHKVIQRFKDAGLRVKREKCVINVPEVDFLGFRVTAAGIFPTDAKVAAIHEAPPPKNKQELQAFLGLLNFYHSFLKGKATIAEPLHRLLDEKTVWTWGMRQQTAFDALKSLLSSNTVLTHYDPTKPVVLTCDASPVGIGAALSHRLDDSREVPIAFHSHTLSKAEYNYAQIDREALAIVSSVKKYHDHLYAREFVILTDHKPLLGIFWPDKVTPPILSPRML